MTSTTLLEPSFADLIAAMERAGDIAEDRRRHWTCSIRQLAKWLARPVEGMPARWSAIRFPVGQLHHARLGVTAKTLANHRANAKAALRWFSKENDLPQHGVRLRPEWMRLSREIDKRTWQRFSGLARFCSARGIGISDVNDDAFVIYWVYRTETTGLATHDTAKRFMIRAWNACADASEGWDLQRLAEPPLKKPCLPGRRFRSVSGRASTTIWQDSLKSTERLLASELNHANRQRFSTDGPSLLRLREWLFGSASRSSIYGHSPRCCTPTLPKRSSMFIGKKTAKSQRPAPLISAGKYCAWPVKVAPWAKRSLAGLMR